MKILLLLLMCLGLCLAGRRNTEAIKDAMDKVQNQGKSIRRAAMENSISESTLRDYLSGRRDITQASHRGLNRILTNSQEIDLVNYISWMSDRGFPLTTTIIQSLACEISNSSPTLRWVQMFLKRHNLSLVCPKQYNRGKCSTVSHEAVDHHFQILKEFYEKHQIADPAKILNINETGWGKSQTVFNKVAIPKGSKSHFQRSTYTMNHTTSVHCAAANGQTLPTMVIYKNCIPRWIHTEGLPSDWVFTSSDTGFINADLFYEWMVNVLIPYVKRIGPPVVLTLDQATPHLSLRVIQLAMSHGIELFAFLPGASFLLQPLDQVFYSLKMTFAKISVQLCLVAAAFIVNKAKFASVLVQAEKTAFTKDAIKKAFQKTGVYPLNSNAIDRSKIPIPKRPTSSHPSSTSAPSTSTSQHPSSDLTPASSPLNPNSTLHPVTSLNSTTPSLDPTQSASTTPNSTTTPSSNQNASEECKECGRKEPCPSCVLGRNPLLRLGVLSDSTCAKILFPPTLPKSGTKTKRKISSSKVLTVSDLHEPDIPSQSPDRPTPSETVIEITPDPQPIPKKSKKSAKKTNKQSAAEKKEDEFHQSFLCEVCGVRGHKKDSENGIDWVGCDKADQCGRWFHYHCLTYDERIAVDMSIVESDEWLCSECAVMHGQLNVPCSVCMVTVLSSTDGSVAICSQCAGVCHLCCLSERKQIQYHMYVQRGGSWLCNACSFEE